MEVHCLQFPGQLTHHKKTHVQTKLCECLLYDREYIQITVNCEEFFVTLVLPLSKLRNFAIVSPSYTVPRGVTITLYIMSL